MISGKKVNVDVLTLYADEVELLIGVVTTVEVTVFIVEGVNCRSELEFVFLWYYFFSIFYTL